MSFPKQTIHELDSVEGRQALVRVDFNVPIEDGEVKDQTRLKAAEPTISHLRDHGASVILMSHLGRPGGSVDEDLRFNPVVEPLQEILGCSVQKADDVVGDTARDLSHRLDSGDVGLLENVRFEPGEKENDPEFSRQLSELGDFYVSDAFGAAHRRHASMAGVPKHLNPAVAGELMYSEYEILTEVRDQPDRPFVALLGGAKVSDKLPVIEKFLDRADYVLVGGAMAYTFTLAKGGDIGDSLVEEAFVDDARHLLDHRDEFHGELVLPEDVVVTPSDNPGADTKIVAEGDIPDGWEGMDIGPETRDHFELFLEDAAMTFWNGPLGVFEMDAFAEGTNSMARFLADQSSRVIIGGGDSGSAVSQIGLQRQFEHVSTGGGAALDLIQGKTLPGYSVLDDRV